MPGDWIKLEKTTLTKPEVFQLADILGVDRATVVLALLTVWCWLDSECAECNAPSVTESALNALSGVTGFTQAMVQVGWLEPLEHGYCIPNFERHLSKSAKRRALTARRVQGGRTQNVTLPALHQRYQSKSKSKSIEGRVLPSTDPAPRARERDPIWDAVVVEFFSKLDTKKIPKTTATRIGRIVRDLKAYADCTASEIATRRKRMVREFGEKGDTAESLAKHWAKFGRGGADWFDQLKDGAK